MQHWKRNKRKAADGESFMVERSCENRYYQVGGKRFLQREHTCVYPFCPNRVRAELLLERRSILLVLSLFCSVMRNISCLPPHERFRSIFACRCQQEPMHDTRFRLPCHSGGGCGVEPVLASKCRRWQWKYYGNHFLCQSCAVSGSMPGDRKETQPLDSYYITYLLLAANWVQCETMQYKTKNVTSQTRFHACVYSSAKCLEKNLEECGQGRCDPGNRDETEGLFAYFRKIFSHPLRLRLTNFRKLPFWDIFLRVKWEQSVPSVRFWWTRSENKHRFHWCFYMCCLLWNKHYSNFHSLADAHKCPWN